MSESDRLRSMLDELGVKWWTGDEDRNTYWESRGLIWEYFNDENGDAWLGFLGVHESDVTPEQAIAATLGDDEYERKMDSLLSRLTNGKWSKSRAYDLDFMVSCIEEEFEDLYEGAANDR